MIAASPTVRVSGPAWSSDQLWGTTPSRLTRPKVALSPTTPQAAAGIRMEPPVSEPSAAAHSPAATAAPEPPLDPDGTRSSAQGLRTGGVTLPHANSWVRVLPISTAPARRRRVTAAASLRGNAIPGAVVPAVVGLSAVR